MSPACLRLLLPFAVLLRACSESSDRITEPRDSKPQQVISAVPGTARGINALVEAVAAAWAAKDAAAYAASYAIDAEFLNPFGGILVGRVPACRPPNPA